MGESDKYEVLEKIGMLLHASYHILIINIINIINIHAGGNANHHSRLQVMAHSESSGRSKEKPMALSCVERKSAT